MPTRGTNTDWNVELTGRNVLIATFASVAIGVGNTVKVVNLTPIKDYESVYAGAFGGVNHNFDVQIRKRNASGSSTFGYKKGSAVGVAYAETGRTDPFEAVEVEIVNNDTTTRSYTGALMGVR